jgi:hypothetical protein
MGVDMNTLAVRMTPISCLLAGLLLHLWLAPVALAQATNNSSFLEKPKTSYETKRDAIHKKYLEDGVAGISNKYCELLADYSESSRAQGDLSGYLAAHNELVRFQSQGTLEESNLVADCEYVAKTQRAAMGARASNLRKMQQEESLLQQSYIQFLERSKITLTQQNQIDQAIEVNAEIQSIRANLIAPPAISAAHAETVPAGDDLKTSAAPPTAIQKPVATNRLVVIASNNHVPVANLDVVLRSQTFNKVFAEKTDRAGRVEFRILPELEYMICVLDPRFLPYFQPQCRGGESYPIALEVLPEGVKFLELPVTGDLNLPGISGLHICGYSAFQGVIKTVTLQTSSTRTAIGDTPPGQDTASLSLDIWTTISERSRSLEVKLLAPTPTIRIVLYRELAPAPGPAVPAVAVNPPAQNAGVDPAHLTVLAKNPKDPVQGVEVLLYSQADGKAMSKKTDKTGTASFEINPDVEYTIQIANKRFEPFVKSSCIGGETYVAELPPMPKGIEMIIMGRAGDLQLPGIAPLQIFGSTGASGSITGIYLRPTTVKTLFSGNAPGQDRILLNVDQWMTVSERIHSVEIKMLAPTADVRIVLYRKLS